jgi:hypothetical protein
MKILNMMDIESYYCSMFLCTEEPFACIENKCSMKIRNEVSKTLHKLDLSTIIWFTQSVII